MKNKTYNIKKGFTLLEITVVVAITTLLATIFFANYRGGEKQFALQRSVHQLAQDLRRTEEMAISARKFEDSDGNSIFPKGGYGIYLNINPSFGECESASKGYCLFLFADCNDDNKYNPSGSALTCAEATPGTPYPSEKIEELSLESGIKVSEFSPSGDFLTVTFFPPDPEVTFNLQGSDLEEDSVFINLTINGSVRKVKIYKTGLIEID